MKFLPMPMQGAYVIEIEPLEDDRGIFARSFCRSEFADRGLDGTIAQCSLSWNAKRGTLRGLHYQDSPHEETKLVRCTQGAIWDVIVDLRPQSATRFAWHSVELSSDNRRAIYVPRGFAHGFQTLVDGSEVLYQISEFYHPESARGLRWDDPSVGIRWPLSNPTLSERDRSFPLLRDAG